MAALDFHGDFTGAQFSGDLFVEHADHNKAHDLALTRRQRIVAASQLAGSNLLVTRYAVPLQSLINRVQQILISERFGQELDCAGFHRSYGHRNVSVTGNEDDWNLDARISETALKVQTI